MVRSSRGPLVTRARIVLVIAALLAVAGGIASTTLFDRLTAGGFYDQSAESGEAARVLEDVFDQEPPNLTLLVTAPSGVDDPAVAAAGTELVRRLAGEEGVAQVLSYWTAQAPQLRSTSGEQALVLASLRGDESTVTARLEELLPRYEGERGLLQVTAGGSAVFQKELNEQSQEDGTRGEMLAFPVTLVVLVLVFGTIVAATTPLVVALVTLLCGMGVIWVLAGLTELSVFAVSVSSLLGLGLAIDYSLLVISRYREELRAGRSVDQAVASTMRSAGRTVLFSGITVAVALSSLLWFPLGAVRSIAYGGIAIALLSVVTSLTVLPALLTVLGPRIDKGRILRRRTSQQVTDGTGFWHALALLVMRRPVTVATGVLIVLLLLGLPALGMRLGMPDERIMGESSSARQVATTIMEDFDSSEQNVLPVVAPVTGGRTAEIGAHASALSSLPNVARVDTVTGSYVSGSLAAPPTPANERFRAGDAVYLSVVPAGGTDELGALVERIRETPAPFPTLVGGTAAVNEDTTTSLMDRLPYALATIAITMVVLLFLLTGSVVLPFLALALSALSLTATFGALVWIFQEGHLSGLLGFTATGTTTSTIPVMLFALAFGLALDYQVFMLSRMREEYERTNSPTEAVALGLEKMGRTVTAAAVLISIVFLAFLVSEISMVKAYGIGLPLAVLIDATLIRGALLPATMKLGGQGMWWAPSPLRRLHDRFALREDSGDLLEPPVPRPDLQTAQQVR